MKPFSAEHIFLNIRAAMPSLRPAEQRVAQFCLTNAAEAATLSISKLASRCNTSTTSVVRFTQRLGYEHFVDFRLDLSADIAREQASLAAFPEVSGDIDVHDSLSDVVAKVVANETLSISDTSTTLNIEQLAKAVELINHAHRVDSFGIGASAIVSMDLQQKLTRIGQTALSWSDTHAAWTSAVTLTPTAVAVAISHSGRTPEIVRYLSSAKDAGAATIAITNFADSPLTNHADVTLTTAARETPFRSGALGSRIAQLMVIDCLFVGVTQARYEQAKSAIKKTYLALHDSPTAL